MKKMLISVAAAALLVTTGCGGADNEEGQQGTQNNNIEPVKFKNHDNALDRNNRNYTMQRDLEEPNNYDVRNINNTTNDDNNKGKSENDNNDSDQYEVANEAADQLVKKIDVLDNAYVLTTENNAYVAADLKTHQNGNNLNNKNGEITDEVKKKISSIVKSVDPDIDNVYVSTNPDFMDLANNYADDIDNGEPIEGLFEEIGNMIERVFPENQ
jgi:spore cortex protein